MMRPLHYFTTRLEGEEETKGEDQAQHRLVVAFFDSVTHCPSNVPIALCRTGLVKFAYHFAQVQSRTTGETNVTTHAVAFKIMDQRQQRSQYEDVDRELRVMEALRPEGFSKRRAILLAEPNARQHNQREREYFPQWQFFEDTHNHYMTTEFASNGSLVLYSNKRFNLYWGTLTGLAPPRDFSFGAAVAKLWREDVLFIFKGLVQAIEFMHAKGVCHLDLDVHNIVIDSSGNPIIVDFGSSEVADTDGIVGRGRSILCKIPYCAPQVYDHNRNRNGKPGVNGRAADMYSLGVILYWLLFIYSPRRNIIVDPVKNHGQWHYHLFQHLKQDFADHDDLNCVFQFHDPLDHNIAHILEGLLQTQPENRTKASQLREYLKDYNYQIQDDTLTRCQALVEGYRTR